MTTELSDFQFEILPNESADSGFVFGIGAEVSVNDSGFDPGENEWIVQDTVNSRRGVNAFGRDVIGGKTWVWTSHTNLGKASDALEALERFSLAWSPEDLVSQPGAQTAIRYCMGGRTRRVFGRPRRFAAPPSNLILGGYVPVTHDFKLVDARSYDDKEGSVEIPYYSTVDLNGFIFPATFPLMTTANVGVGNSQIVVGGNVRTYPVIRFNGPWTNPAIYTDDWSISWFGSVADGDWIEIDARPWGLTVLDQDGSSVVGGNGTGIGLSRKTRLEECYLKPGTQPQIQLDGVATSGTASATIRWRNAWSSM